MNDQPASESIAEAAGAAWTALNAADRERANAFLDKQKDLATEQEKLVRLQTEELRRELKLHHWSARFHHISSILKLAFELALALLVLGLSALIAGAVWSAAHDHGAVIEAFSVPPDLASRGLTGEVVAAKVLDRLTAMQTATNSSRAASSYASNWGDNIKVQIPDTGVSIGEFNRYLHEWLGRQTRITGEVYRTENGLAVSARANGTATPVYAGQARDLDSLIDKTARAVYRITQPYRYAIYLWARDRDWSKWTAQDTEADAIMNGLIESGSVEDRAWSYDGMGMHRLNFGNLAGAIAKFRIAIAAGAGFDTYFDLAGAEGALIHPNEELKVRLAAEEVASRGGEADLDPSAAKILLLRNSRSLAELKGDLLAARGYAAGVHSVSRATPKVDYGDDVIDCGLLHDEACVQSLEAEHPIDPEYRRFADILLGRFRTAANEGAAAQVFFEKPGVRKAILERRVDIPERALVAAALGDFTTARALIAATPPDCTDCERTRANIETLARNWDGAAHWFAVAAAQAPDYPYTWSDWGAMLLRKGDTDGAIAKLALAHAKGPHFADPLEMWGEALIAKNRSDLALAKFEEANKYAPSWGRLHLEWGKALVWSGDRAAARNQSDIASRLDLSAAERRQLDVLRNAAKS